MPSGARLPRGPMGLAFFRTIPTCRMGIGQTLAPLVPLARDCGGWGVPGAVILNCPDSQYPADTGLKLRRKRIFL